MTEYDIAFAKRLADTAVDIVSDGIESLDAQRTVLYLSLLSCEIALKAVLEKAGVPLTEIRKRSHNLKHLLQDVCQCKIEVEVVQGTKSWQPAIRLRSLSVDNNHINATIGTLLEAEELGASIYPNQIRYGDLLKHYPAELLAKVAHSVCEWVEMYWNSIRV